MHRSHQRGAVHSQDSSAQQASSSAHRTRAPCKPSPPACPLGSVFRSNSRHSWSGSGEESSLQWGHAVFDGVLQFFLGSHV